ncbi:Ribosomal_protein S4 [Hexamita inflata]|uniref:40S ribosomal protein S4 n=1 Tax=Hexamita inflata TaxID=28002 RepID=A0AA86NUJ6_9EUKA|nr:Ribosomal protein S4 [Hexamita inflata]CAI9926054.1 Ribosomal protein S4 [Hexamita inflata]CAI9928357.1 Ribosomal protein S4 [Hexamita inflata]
MKRLNAPHHWMLHKMGGIYAPRPSEGPHKIAECLPLTLIVRNRLHLARDMREAGMVIRQKNIAVDGKPRMDEGYPAGFMDVLTVAKTNKNYRIMYDTKGRFQLLPIKAEEAQYKLLKIKAITTGEKGIFYGHTHDGRNIRFLDVSIQTSDTIKFNLKTGEVSEVAKFETNALAQVTAGKNCGRIGKIAAVTKYDGSHTMVQLVDSEGQKFITRQDNVFVLGKEKSLVTIPSSNGVRANITKNRELRLKSLEKQHKQE